MGGIAGASLSGVLLLALLLATSFVSLAPTARAQDSLTVTMRDSLSFEPGTYVGVPGTNVTVRLINAGVLPHTFTLFAEVNASVPVNDFNALQEFHARSATLLDVSLGGSEEATVNFIVPAGVGTYTFVCMIAGHAAGGMHGAMFVGITPGGGDGGIGIVQGLLIIALIGVGVFAVIYQIRSTRS